MPAGVVRQIANVSGSGLSLVTPSVAPNADELLVLAVESGNNAISSVTGCGLTWSFIVHVLHTNAVGGLTRMELWKAQGASPTPGAVTITFSGDDGRPTAATLAGFAQAISSATPHTQHDINTASIADPLSGFVNAYSIGYSALAYNGTSTVTVGSSMTALDISQPSEYLATEYSTAMNNTMRWDLSAADTNWAQASMEIVMPAWVDVGIASETDEALTLASISGGTTDTVTVGIASETDEALPLLEVRTGPIVKGYPVSGTLGCGIWTVQVSRRGGSPVEVEVPATSVRMNRTEDDVSSASASFTNSDVPDWCIGALGELRPWVYELSLLRDNEEVWDGPISNQLTFTPSKATIDARDLAAWMERRNLPTTRMFNDTDITTIFVQLVLDALSRDPSPNISLDAMLTGLLIDKTVLSTDHVRAADALRDLAAFGVDFTMLGRVMRLRPRGGGDLLPNPLLDAHLLEEPQATLDGIQAASEWVVTGATPSISGAAGGVGIDTGLVTQSYNDPDITRSADARKAAVELLATSGAEPLTVTCALDPDAPFAFNDLIPGNFIDTHLSFGHYHVNEVLMLTGLDVQAEAGTEKVNITLIRGYG